MGARGGISTLLLLLLVVCQPQSLHAGPPAGGKPRPASPPEGWSGEKSGGMMLGFGWAGRDGDPAASGMGTHGCRLSLPELRGGPVAKLAGGRRGSCLFSGRVFGPGRPAGKGEGGSGAARPCGSRGAAYPGCVRRFPWGGNAQTRCWEGRGSLPARMREPQGFGLRRGQPTEEKHLPRSAKALCHGDGARARPCSPGRESQPSLPMFGLGRCRWESRSWTAFARVRVTSCLCSVRLSWAPWGGWVHGARGSPLLPAQSRRGAGSPHG